jgi:acyl carrier protein phosphodiesterase
MIGNFIGDFVRGRNLTEQFTRNIALGIELHREIDEFTDSHRVVLESKKRLRPKYRHYAPVIVDVFYDHFLAIHWNDYHKMPLAAFAANAYYELEQRKDILPERVLYLLPYMIRGNWLVNYSNTEGIHRALSGMAQRTPYESKMEEATADLKKYFTEFDKEFLAFFPELVAMSKSFIHSNKID